MKVVKKLDTAVAIFLIIVGLPVIGGLAYAACSDYLKHRREIAALQGETSNALYSKVCWWAL